MPYFLVSKHINEGRVSDDIWTVLTSVDPSWSKVLWFFVPNQSFELLFAFVAQWDNWVSWLGDGSSKWFSCFREWMLTIAPGSATESNSLSSFSSLGEVVLSSSCQCFASTRTCSAEMSLRFCMQFLLLFSPGSVHSPGAVSTVWSTAGWAPA